MKFQSDASFFRDSYLIFFSVILVPVFFSCKTTHQSTAYFRNIIDSGFIRKSSLQLEPLIRPNDMLNIMVSSMNREEDMIFNSAGVFQNAVSPSGIAGSGYIVNENGQILLHHLGLLKVAGLSRRQLQDKLQRDLQSHFKDPIVTIQFVNRNVTVIGDVSHPQVIALNGEKPLSIMDALAICGDLTSTARRDNILIVRDNAKGSFAQRINLEDKAIFSSDYYFLQPNDIVYVSPNDEKKMKEEKRARSTQIFSLAVSSLSLIIIIVDRILK